MSLKQIKACLSAGHEPAALPQPWGSTDLHQEHQLSNGLRSENTDTSPAHKGWAFSGPPLDSELFWNPTKNLHKGYRLQARVPQPSTVISQRLLFVSSKEQSWEINWLWMEGIKIPPQRRSHLKKCSHLSRSILCLRHVALSDHRETKKLFQPWSQRYA